MNYYNDNDPKAAAWLRELIKQNLVPPGDVDERSIEDVTGADLKGYTQCHFFAGIGGWSEALRLAGWPADRPVWTGSCPCQPFSSAGKRKGTKDPRHLWPEFCRLIAECRPPVVFGEQVASKAGRLWLSGVRIDLEALGYAVGAADLCAAGVGAPHIRQRLYWVADSAGQQTYAANKERLYAQSGGSGGNGRMADSEDERCERGGGTWPRREGFENNGTNGGVDDTHNNNHRPQKQESTEISMSAEIGDWENVTKPRKPWGTGCYVLCKDGKARRIEPSICPLADGLPGRVALLRGYGNAIVPQVAAEFIRAYIVR